MTVKNVVDEVDMLKELGRKLTELPQGATCQADLEKAIKERLDYADIIVLNALVVQRIEKLLDMEVKNGNDD